MGAPRQMQQRNLTANADLAAKISALRDPARTRAIGRAAEILEKATDLLSEGGFETFSMRRVAERAGLTLAALQYHFPTRADLVREMIEHRVDLYEDEMRERLARLPDDPERVFLGVIDWLLDDCRFEPAASFTVQFWAFAAYDEQGRILLDRYMFHYRALLGLLIRRLNPAVGEAESVARGAVLSVMIDGSVTLVAPGKPEHAELSHLHETFRATALSLAKAPPTIV